MSDIQTNRYLIYIRDHESYTSRTTDKLCKVGICTMSDKYGLSGRESTYITGEVRRGKFIKVIEILPNDLNINNKDIEDGIHEEFSDLHIHEDGGTEFFKFSIIDKIEQFLLSCRIPFKLLTLEEVKELQKELKREEEPKSSKLKVLRESLLYPNKRDQYQQLYLDEVIKELLELHRCFIKAPTGFGKTHLFYKIIKLMGLKKILILTPRRKLCEQATEDKYTSKYLDKSAFSFVNFSYSKNKEASIKSLKSKDNFIVTSCYHSRKSLIEQCTNQGLKFDLIIFDEAHFIQSMPVDHELFCSDMTTYRVFASATPTEEMTKRTVYGKIIEKIQIYTLINEQILCNIETIIKQLNDYKSQYHNLKDLIVSNMIKFNKRKGIIYVNNRDNAQSLYKLMKTQNQIETYIYVSGDIDVLDDYEEKIDSDTEITAFEDDINPAVIICVQKIGYGYDNDQIDFICLGDPRQSETDIRQIVGRGLRWNKDTYTNKVLHMLIPLYKDEFGNTGHNEQLKNYLEYIIGECGQEVIMRSTFDIPNSPSDSSKETTEGKSYNGNEVPSEILSDYCTTGHRMFTMFKLFLKSHNICDENSYNMLQSKEKWMPNFANIREKYDTFCFRDILKDKIAYYELDEAKIAKERCVSNIKEEIGIQKFKKLNEEKINIRCNSMDNRIPMVSFEWFYPSKL